MLNSLGANRIQSTTLIVAWHRIKGTKEGDDPWFLRIRSNSEGKHEVTVPKISQETLAEMIGTTRSRVSFFMNRFRKLGFIDYHGSNDLQVHGSLLNIVLHD